MPGKADVEWQACDEEVHKPMLSSSVQWTTDCSGAQGALTPTPLAGQEGVHRATAHEQESACGIHEVRKEGGHVASSNARTHNGMG